MEAKEITYYAKLVAKCEDGMGYTNYVFERFEYEELRYKYIMCVRFPNWFHGSIEIGEVGYVSVRYVDEGVDKWYDGTDLIPYKDSNIIFLKFIQEKPTIDNGNIVLD